MNANELADYLENDFQIQEAVIDMLRQLQAEIEALKKQLDTSNKAYMWLEETLYEYKRKREPTEIDELTAWANAEEEAQRDNEQFFKDLKAGKISLKPKD